MQLVATVVQLTAFAAIVLLVWWISVRAFPRKKRPKPQPHKSIDLSPRAKD